MEEKKVNEELAESEKEVAEKDIETATETSKDNIDKKDSKKKEKDKKKSGKGLAVAGIVLLIANLGVTASSLYVSLNAMKNSKDARNYSQEVKTMFEEETGLGETAEDDVRIASEYTIKSTKQISDAYLSGDTSELSDKDKETLQMAKDVIDEVIKEDMTPYEKEEAIYLWMTKELGQDKNALLVIPTDSSEVDNPHGVLKSGNAVCVGYATTFRLFMEMLGIECHVVHNSEAYHSWDLVKLDDDWYHVDIYSDAHTGNYSHFNITDNMLADDGENWDREFFPAANGVKYNYFYNTMVTVEDVYGVPSEIRKAMDEKQAGIYIKFKGELTKTDMTVATEIVGSIAGSMMKNNDWNEDWEDGEWNYGPKGMTRKDYTMLFADENTSTVTQTSEEMLPAGTSTDAEELPNGIDISDLDELPEGIDIEKDKKDTGLDLPTSIMDSGWMQDPTDNGYILKVVFGPYKSEANGGNLDIDFGDIDKDKVNEKLKESFGDIFEDISVDNKLGDFGDDDYLEDYHDNIAEKLEKYEEKGKTVDKETKKKIENMR